MYSGKVTWFETACIYYGKLGGKIKFNFTGSFPRLSSLVLPAQFIIKLCDYILSILWHILSVSIARYILSCGTHSKYVVAHFSGRCV
jgi:hypothetical protein